MQKRIFTLLFLILAAGIQLLNAQIIDYDIYLDTAATAPVPKDTVVIEKPVVWPETMAQKLEKYVKSSQLLRSSTCGIMVYDLTTDSILFTYNEQQRLRPASTMKVLTSTAALDRLGKDHLFRTRLAHTGMVEEHEWFTANTFDIVEDTMVISLSMDTVWHKSRVLYGDLLVKGAMDPMFSSKDLNRFVESVAALKVDTIYGNLIIDLSLKDSILLGEGWCWDDVNPTLTPMLVDKKDEFKQLFMKGLSRKGISINGEILKGDFRDLSTPLCEVRHSLYEILQRTLKNSDNTYAECIFYKLGGEISKIKGVSAESGRMAVNDLIRSAGFDPANYYIADGSGLSHYSHLSPELEVGILRYAFSRPNIYNVLYERMPIAGIDGTLGGRMKGTAAYNNVHAKTGTLTGVSTLAGYCRAPNGHLLCFSIMNSGIGSASQGRSFQDGVCVIMCSTK